MAFVRSTPRDYDGSTGSMHAYKLLAGSVWKDNDNVMAEGSRSLGKRMVDWMPARLVSFVVRFFFTPRHARSVDYRVALVRVRDKLTSLKLSSLKRSLSLPYAASPAVQRLLHRVRLFYELEQYHHVN